MLAFVVLAVALGLLLGMLSRGLKPGDAVAGGDRGQPARAKSLLDQLGTLEPLKPGVSDGEFERRPLSAGAWRSPSRGSGAAADRRRWRSPTRRLALSAPMLYRVALDVELGRGATGAAAALRHLRLRSPPPTAGAADRRRRRT